MTTYNGHIENLRDAVLIFEACRVGALQTVPRRLNDDERRNIKSGSVFVWNEKESGIRRWTDRFNWSASKTSDDFLVYSEWSLPRRKSAKSISDAHGLNSSVSNELDFKPVFFRGYLPEDTLDFTNKNHQTKQNKPQKFSLSIPSSQSISGLVKDVHLQDSSAQHDRGFRNTSFLANENRQHYMAEKRSISLNLNETNLSRFIDRPRHKKKTPSQIGKELENGLIKKTISIVDLLGNKNHLVCYYSQSDLRNGSLITPSNDPNFPIDEIPEGIYESDIYDRINELKIEKSTRNPNSFSARIPSTSDSSYKYGAPLASFNRLNVTSSKYNNQTYPSTGKYNRKRHDLSIHPYSQSQENSEKFRRKSASRNISDCRRRIEGIDLSLQSDPFTDSNEYQSSRHENVYRSHSNSFVMRGNNHNPYNNNVRSRNFTPPNDGRNINYSKEVGSLRTGNIRNYLSHNFTEVISNQNSKKKIVAIEANTGRDIYSDRDRFQDLDLNQNQNFHKNEKNKFELAPSPSDIFDSNPLEKKNLCMDDHTPKFDRSESPQQKSEIALKLPPIGNLYSKLGNSYLYQKGRPLLQDEKSSMIRSFRTKSDHSKNKFYSSSNNEKNYAAINDKRNESLDFTQKTGGSFSSPFNPHFPEFSTKDSHHSNPNNEVSFRNEVDVLLTKKPSDDGSISSKNPEGFLPSIQANQSKRMTSAPKPNISSEDARQLNLLKKMF
ncbi:cAMP-independent regulatory protein pac2 [Smittium mucronatum]|uniref:cAMP-independent regulatory protein pac2 n=1 Tax=Smittium mucronatum TaxID=133383 RepID=A0A1R0GYG4_9FUNG|nr:cAMP-independent regulatory protein pac2 [Smittium mucronatum]